MEECKTMWTLVPLQALPFGRIMIIRQRTIYHNMALDRMFPYMRDPRVGPS